MPYQAVNLLKGVVAASGTLLLAWDWWLTRRGRAARLQKPRDIALGALGVLAFAAWFNVGFFHYGSFVHQHEFFHYFLGAKYFPELGYTRLYHCVAVADVQDGHGAEARSRWIRNLETNIPTEGARFADDPGGCLNHFSPDRWTAFAADVRWFRSHVTDEKWRELGLDHGYNATPFWTAVGGGLANRGPASDERLLALALLDPALLVVMWAVVWWAFGWRTLAVALIWWGTNYPARFVWTGGAFLRADWLAALVIAICLAKRGSTLAAAGALALSSVWRVFPLLVTIGPLVGALADAVRLRSITPLKRLAPAALVTAAVIALVVAATSATSAGGDLWQQFARNTAKHARTQLANHVGLPALLSFDERSRSAHVTSLWIDTPWDVWRSGRDEALASRRWILWSALAAFLVLLGAACRGRERWITLVLGVGVIPMSTSLTSYYYAMLLAFAFLWPRVPVAGAGLLLLSALSNLAALVFTQTDDVFVAFSGLLVAYIVAVTASVLLDHEHGAVESSSTADPGSAHDRTSRRLTGGH